MTEPAPDAASARSTDAAAAKPGASPRHHAPAHGHHHHAHAKSFHAHVVGAATRPTPPLPEATGKALSEAIAREHVPTTWQPNLEFIVAHESGGKVGAANHVDTARGLFQLTRASYHHNPSGAASFGNATEEAQGGIRYIKERYQTADNAVAFWQRHGWY